MVALLRKMFGRTPPRMGTAEEVRRVLERLDTAMIRMKVSHASDLNELEKCRRELAKLVNCKWRTGGKSNG